MSKYNVTTTGKTPRTYRYKMRVHVLQMTVQVLLTDEPFIAVCALPVRVPVVGLVQLVLVIHIQLLLQRAAIREVGWFGVHCCENFRC
jgi:hypothetical protein